MAFSLDEAQQSEFSRILSRYPNKQAACIPVLHLCQAANGNFISDEVSAAHVKGVVTFYSLFNSEPCGKHDIWVCRTLSCALRGSAQLIEACEKKLGVKVGHTTSDGRVTLRTAECLASCGTAPVVQVDDAYHENLSTADVERIIDDLLAHERTG